MERVHAVDRDPAADQVEPCGGLPQRRGGVRGVAHDAKRVGPRQKALELLGHERGIVVGGGEMGHRPCQPFARGGGDPRCLFGIARAEPAHPGVQLDVDASVPRQARDEVLAPGDHVGVRLERDRELVAGERAHDQQPAFEPRGAELRGLAGGRHRQPGRTAAPCGPGSLDRTVAVAVRLHHRAQRRQRGQPCAVALDRTGVDARLRPQHGATPRSGRRARRSA